MSGSMRYRDGAWRLTAQAGGRRHYATVKAPDNRTGRAEASRALAALVTQIDQGQHLGDRTTTVAQLLDAWLRHHGPSLEAGTRAGYRQTVDRHLRPNLGDTLLHRLRPHHLDHLYSDLRDQGLAPKTVRNIAGTLHAALGQAVRWGWIPRNPADAATPPAAKRKAVTVPEAEEVARVIAASRPDFATMVRLAAHTGHRRGSLLALRWTDVDLDRGSVTFARAIAVADGQLIEKGTKADRIDRSTLGATTLDVLRQHRARNVEAALACGAALAPTAHLFAQAPDGAVPWHPGGVTQRWRAACKRAGVHGVRFHDLRHFAITHMLSAGVPPHVVGQRVGIGVATMTAVYAHHLPRADQDAAEMMDRLLG